MTENEDFMGKMYDITTGKGTLMDSGLEFDLEGENTVK